MHASSLLRMEWFIRTFLDVSVTSAKKHVLDVGSYDVNGTYKHFFPEETYTYCGLDMSPGPNVDICPKNPYDWVEIESGAFDAVISGQAFEHIEFFWVTMAEIARVTRPGGLVCIIAPRGFDEHRYPVDCYRFLPDGMVALARYTGLTPLHASMNLAPPGADPQWYSNTQADTLLVAKKPMHWKGPCGIRKYDFLPADLAQLATGMVAQAVPTIGHVAKLPI